MDDIQSHAAKQATSYRNIAFAFIVGGGFLTVIAVFTLFDTATRPWNSTGYVLSVDDARDMQAFTTTQPQPDEWPLSVARSGVVADHRSNRYTVEVTPVRGTAVLRIDVVGRSPDSTTAFARWLTGLFAHDLSTSLASHGVAQPFHPGADSLVSEPPGPAVPLRLHPGTLVLSLLTPLLLLLSGVVLHRATRANYPKA